MTRILVQRGSGSSSSNQNRSSQPSSSTAPPQPLVNPPQDDDVVKDEASLEEAPEPLGFDGVSENCGSVESKNLKIDDVSPVAFDQSANADDENVDLEKVCSDDLGQVDLMGGFGGLPTREQTPCESDCRSDEAKQGGIVTVQPPSPPIPPPRPLLLSMSNTGRSGSSRRAAGWPTLSRASPTGSRPSSPRSHCEGDGYNSADERSPRFVFSYNEIERERQFEIDIRRSEGLEVKRMVGDGNCLFRAVADQVYGDPELYDLTRQMCIDYMERERDHFSQFITEGFTSYSKRKRRDQVYGNNMEIQAFSEMYNRPIHIYSYSTEPINIFHGNYRTDMPPIRLSYHHGNHYNSLVDPRRLTVGAGLGFSSLHGRNAGKDQVKAAMNAQQEQLIDNALIAEGRFYSDMELTEKEIERMVMEASRAEYLSNAGKFNHQLSYQESSTSSAEPSSSGAARPSRSDNKKEVVACGLNSSVQMLLSMGFSYLQALEAYSIFGDDLDSMICYLIETSNGNRLKGKEATE